MKHLTYLAPLFVLLACGQKDKQRTEAIDRYLMGQVEHYKFNGAVLVGEGGEIVYQKAFGVRDFRTNTPLNDSCIFQLASVSKQFTAYGILLLEKQGKLSVTDTLRTFFPELPYYDITLHHLLTHTSGLPDYEYAMRSKWDPKRIAFNKDLLSFLAQEKPAMSFREGTKWEYSNTGYALLACVIEKVSGMSFKDYMKTEVFEPLGMNHTVVYSRGSSEQIKNYADGYVWSGSMNEFVLPDSVPGYEFVYYEGGIQGDGGIASTTADLFRWMNAFANANLIDAAIQKRMIYPHTMQDTAANVHYGYGFFIGRNNLGDYVSHPGYWPGYETSIARYADNNRTVIVLSNNESPARFIQAGIANILFDQPIVFPYSHRVATQDSLSLDLFTGSYSFNGWNFDLIRKHDTIYQVFGPGYQRVYLPESGSKIFPVDGQDIQFEIGKTGQGEVKHYVVAYGVKEEMKTLLKRE